jgi:hypothetical protein
MYTFTSWLVFVEPALLTVHVDEMPAREKDPLAASVLQVAEFAATRRRLSTIDEAKA